ncbi:death domain-containing protein [Dactylosporangium sp. CS-033363]|uniref:death domain-containing protein n=1 Tax=Dactylosporangium sp. CS-033363 TaxID=3239935 RepID=UPI003D8C48A9
MDEVRYEFQGPVYAPNGTFGVVFNNRPDRERADPSSEAQQPPLRVAVCSRLTADWPDLADWLGIPTAQRKRFERGREPHEIWDWVEQRGELGRLREALAGIQRLDLVALFDAAGAS